MKLCVLARAAIILLLLIMWFLVQQAVVIPNQCSIGDHFPFPVLFNTLFLTVLACEARSASGSRGSGGVSSTYRWELHGENLRVTTGNIVTGLSPLTTITVLCLPVPYAGTGRRCAPVDRENTSDHSN